MAGARQYWAFLSYSHRDRQWAEWLHRGLENYRVPKSLIGSETASGPVTPRLTPIFCDREELAAADDLTAEIRTALAGSRYLIVLCSRAAARSRWIEAEIVTFKELHPDGHILAAILDGEPFASERSEGQEEECFPPSLRQRFDSEGHPTGERSEPIAADFRPQGDGKQLGLMKLVAGMLGVPLDEIVQREAHRRQKRLTLVAAMAIVGMLIMTGMATLAIQARNEARHQREQAEALVGFMLGDLRTRLEPVGRLDVLDAVGSRVLGYYQGQSSGDLSDEALLQRARALTLIGEIANRRGDLDAALARYRESMAGTEEALRRAPNDPQRIFDHAQNVYWVGYIGWQRGQPQEAERGFRAYRQLAGRLLAIDANRPEWRLEAIYADNNLGLVLYEGGHYDRAAQTFNTVLLETERLRAANPGNTNYREMEWEALANLADAQEQSGRLDEAIAARERQLRGLEQAAATDRQNSTILRKAVAARRALGRLFASRGDAQAATRHLDQATVIARGLRERDPENMEWLHLAATVDLDMGDLMLATNRTADAATVVRAGCASAERLVGRDRSVRSWGNALTKCLILRGRIAAAQGYGAEALTLARRAIAFLASRPASRVTSDPRYAVARARLLEGDQLSATRDPAGAAEAWRAALNASGMEGGTLEMRTLRHAVLRRLGQAPQAESVATALEQIGYRHPAFTSERNRR